MLCDKYREFGKWIIYQIYPRSFMDANGDGIGDLQGIISRLDHIRELGCNAVWLCPCFKSPNEDNGYDIADYRDIMDEFGTMEDMDELIEALHSRGMKLILDLVPNHTSTDHRWFRESRKGRDNPYSDYYYWYDEIPNDWKSCFGGSAWQYDEQRGQYYLHSFAVGQADLNWENPAVVKEMQDIVDFWAAKGCDGFRVDVIDCISKNFETGENGLGPRLHEYIRALFGRREAAHLFTVGEGHTNDPEDFVLHCAAERGELSTLFIFDHMECGRKDKFTPKADSLASLRDYLVKWQGISADNDLLYSLFTDNHDQPQMISRIGNDRGLRYESATDIAMMVYLLKGVPFIYQGQEIGMPASHTASIEEFDDVECLGVYREMDKSLSEEEKLEKVNFGSRDNVRHPMAWDGSANNGFTGDAVKPWLAPHSRGSEVNLEADLASERSVCRFYRELLALRSSEDAFTDGDFEVISKPEDPYFVFTRTLGGESWVVVCNFEREQEISLTLECEAPRLSNLGRGEIEGKYMPYECAAAKLISF
jgi:glycosidase